MDVKTLKKAKQIVFSKKKKQKDPVDDFLHDLESRYEKIDVDVVETFRDLPLSPKTLKGLRECGYSKLTDIQKATIALSLQGKDVLGAAHTGSGKTLAFLVPILELLFRNKWTRLDGLGALVITPTRELAYQIFEELRRVGEHHDFSAGLIIGGKDLKFERNRMDQCNIMICTPGRLLQHMDENPLLDCGGLKVLVLDEADRCLDMGFEAAMNAIIANLPVQRQTLLFSATQTKSVKDLSRLSLKDASYVAVHEHSQFSTPEGLKQSFVECFLQDKVANVWSFIKNHLKQKIIIFLSSCKQVKYLYEIFSKLRPGTSLMALYGSLHQLRRMDIYQSFCNKTNAVLFATDLAARGLDFPQVDWVVQADCPEDVATYIHRVGRTARFHRGGESLLLLLHSELAMVDKLRQKRIPIEPIDINPLKLMNPVRKMQAFLAKDPQLKQSAQRAFVAYAKAVFLMKDKQVFNVESLDTDAFAHSLGLAMPPRIRFLSRLKVSQKKYFYNDDVHMDSDNFLTIKRRNHDIEPSHHHLDDQPPDKTKTLTKAAAAKKMIKKKIFPNKKTIFLDDGNVVTIGDGQTKKSLLAQQYDDEDSPHGGIDIEKAKLVLREEDCFDKKLFTEKIKAKHKKDKEKLKPKKDEPMDAFGDDNQPDLSWLPDPELIYGPKKETTSKAPKKRTIKVPMSSQPQRKMQRTTCTLDLNETEQLALLFLKK